MTSTSLQFVTSPDRPLDKALLDILRRVDTVARVLGIEYFVGGALARDLILLHVFGKNTGRATRDVDLGICVDDWARFDTLRTRLIETGAFSERSGIAHRLYFRPAQSSHDIPLDLLPFGGVERSDRTIAWPPAMNIVMDVSGFAEAHASALRVEVAQGFSVAVSSLPALAVLKLIAWRDRRRETSKDATDFLLIARRYGDAGNLDRLYEDQPALLQATDFDPDLAGAMLLGRDAAELCQENTAIAVTQIVSDASLKASLIHQVLQATLSTGGDAAISTVEAFIEAFAAGFAAAATTPVASR